MQVGSPEWFKSAMQTSQLSFCWKSEGLTMHQISVRFHKMFTNPCL